MLTRLNSFLQEIIEEELARDEQKRRDEVSILKVQAAQAHNQWIQSYAHHAKQRTLTGLYYCMNATRTVELFIDLLMFIFGPAMFMHATYDDTVKKVASTHGMVRWDLLKRGIQALSKSPEAYLAIRSQFARTLATFNVASYIIGTLSCAGDGLGVLI